MKSIIITLIFLTISFSTFGQYNINETMLNANVEEFQDILITTIDNDIEINGRFFCKLNYNSITIIPTNSYHIKITPNLLDVDTKISVDDEDIIIVRGFNDLSFYPNPTKDNLTISTQQKIKSIEIYNSYGVKQKVVNKGKTLDLRTYKEGIYLLKIQLENNQRVTKTIIKQ